MPPPLARFHAILAHRWQRPRTPKRMTELRRDHEFMPETRCDRDAARDATAQRRGVVAGAEQDTDRACRAGDTAKANDAAAFEHAFELVQQDIFSWLLGSRPTGGHTTKPTRRQVGKDERIGQRELRAVAHETNSNTKGFRCPAGLAETSVGSEPPTSGLHCNAPASRRASVLTLRLSPDQGCA